MNLITPREYVEISPLRVQRIGRALRGRIVHHQRARKLRQRGETVLLQPQKTSTGKSVYRWMKRPYIMDYQAEALDNLRSRSWTLDVPAGAGKGITS